MSDCINCECSSCMKRQCMERMCCKCNTLKEDIVESCSKYVSNEEVISNERNGHGTNH